MTPRSVITLGSLFAASFLATWMVAGPGIMPLARAARTVVQDNALRSLPPDALSAERAVAPQSLDNAGSDLRELPDPPKDFGAAARDARAAPTTDERMRALQLLGEAPDHEGIDTLITASAQSVDAGERATAIAALRQRRSAPDADKRISDAFRLAAQDSDPLVAVLAQSALSENQLQR